MLVLRDETRERVNIKKRKNILIKKAGETGF